MKRLLSVILLGPVAAFPQDKSEMVGHVGSRPALIVLHSAQRPEGGWQVSGEYVVLPTLARRYVEGERSPELGITTLKEGASAILFGRDATGELRGTWRDGSFKGTRHGPGGQERERFEFNEAFPSMERYSAALHCRSGEGRQSATLAYVVENGIVKSFDWRSASCALPALAQQPFKGGLRLAAGRCAVTLREVGGEVKVEADECTQDCAAGLEPLLVDRHGGCRMLRPEPR